MDAMVGAAISAVNIEDDTILERWFEHIRAVGEQHVGADWTQLSSALTERRAIGGNRRSYRRAVPRAHEHQRPVADGNNRPPGDHGHGTSREAATLHSGDSAWQAFLPEHRIHWDGTDTSWDQFKTWFLYTAGQHGVYDFATGFVTHAEGQLDKIAAFAQYGLTITAPADRPGASS